MWRGPLTPPPPSPRFGRGEGGAGRCCRDRLPSLAHGARPKGRGCGGGECNLEPRVVSPFSLSPIAPIAGAETFVALDVEATGMDPARHEILEVAAVVFN